MLKCSNCAVWVVVLASLLRAGRLPAQPAPAGAPIRVILDTDMDSDCDDMGALAMLHALADSGEAQILAVMMLFAVRGAGEWWNLRRGGYNHVFDDGRNEWRPTPDRDHAYLVEKMKPAEVTAAIDELMARQPVKQ